MSDAPNKTAAPLDGQRIAITGAAAGIGKELAGRALEGGASVVMIDADATIERVASDAGCVAVQADIATAAQAEQAVDAAWRSLDGLDALVNVAGIYPVTPALSLDEAEWDRVLDVNLKAPFFCSKALARRLIKAKRPGRVLNVSSTASTLARPGVAHYAASKAGLNQLTRVLAVEWAEHGILVNAVVPGIITTERVMAHNRSPEGANEAVAKQARIPLGRFGAPSDVVEMSLFLLSAADYCTGALFTVDGGYTLGLARYEADREASLS